MIEISLYYSVFLDCFSTSTGPGYLPSGCSGIKFRNYYQQRNHASLVATFINFSKFYIFTENSETGLNKEKRFRDICDQCL